MPLPRWLARFNRRVFHGSENIQRPAVAAPSVFVVLVQPPSGGDKALSACAANRGGQASPVGDDIRFWGSGRGDIR